MMVSRGENPYVAIPAFVSRLFRHSGIYIRTDRGIDSPADLKGKRVGLPEYQITANVWIRGILQDEYGVKPADIHWRRGGIEEAGREERAPLKLPPEIDLQQIPHDKTLTGMLESGELDAVIGARAPSCFTRGAPNIARMFPDHRKVEEDYYRRTKIFPDHARDRHPPHHRRGESVAGGEPLQGFRAGEGAAMVELAQIGHLFNSLPFGVSEVAAAKALMGEDFWSYGFEANRHVLETFTRYHHEQGLSAQKVAPEALFAASTLDISKI